jgi:hypothetical protein
MPYNRVKALLRQHKFALFTRPYELNIIGLRNRPRKANSFDDEMHVFYHTEDGKVKYHRFICTTDPGVFWLENPMNGRGTAILKQGQYRNAYALGKHRSTTDALVQIKPVVVLIDNDRNSLLNFKSKTEERGLFGMNIHPAFGREPRKTVDRNSAGCQVIAADKDMALLLQMARRHRDRYGNEFTYTLLDFRQLRDETIKRVAIGGGIVATGLLAWFRPELLEQLSKEVELLLNRDDDK